MNRAVLADTGPLYAITDAEDTHHERANRELALLADEKRQIVVTFPIVLEAYTLILSRLGRNAAIQWLAQMAPALFVNPVLEDYRQAMEGVRSFPDQEISLVDATVAAIAKRLSLQVWTYDYHFDVMRAEVWRALSGS
jgi:predicted nucleic acid-binding protein